MANIKSAIKRIELTRKRTERNKAVKTGVKTRMKKFQAALEQNDDTATDKLRETFSSIDKAVTKGVLHRNTAARRKSRLQNLFNHKHAQ